MLGPAGEASGEGSTRSSQGVTNPKSGGSWRGQEGSWTSAVLAGLASHKRECGKEGRAGRPRKERVRSPRLGEQTGSGIRRSREGNAWREKTREAFRGWNDSGAVRGLSRVPKGGNGDRRARMGRRVRETRAEAEPREPVWVGSQVALGSWDRSEAGEWVLPGF